MKKNYFSNPGRLFGLLSATLTICLSAQAGLYPFSSTYSGANEVPANASTATGAISGVYDDVSNTIYFTLNFSGLAAGTTAAHFHGPVLAPNTNAPVAIGYTGFPTGVTSGSYSRSFVLTDAQETQLMAGQWYSNIHNPTFPGGEIRAPISLGAASSTIYSFNNSYSGSQEVPPNGSTASGSIRGVYNSDNNMIFYTINFSGLSAATTAAHFHGPAIPGKSAGVAIAHAGFPTGVTSGEYWGAGSLSDLQEGQLLSGLWYSNIHSQTYPPGEIRAQLFFGDPFTAPTITCPANIVQANDPDECSASVSFAATATGSPDPAISYWLNGTPITSTHEFAVGTHTVTATAINGGGFVSCTFTVTVNDVQPPVIHNLKANPDQLWPPNHKMKEVTINYTTTDNCPGIINCQVTVNSDEPLNSTGDGNTEADWMVIDDHHAELRAERKGNGDGRVYTITVICSDQYGNASSETTTVTVPHDKGKGVNNKKSAIAVNILPNPSSNNFTLSVNSENTNVPISIRVADQTGRIVEAKDKVWTRQTVVLGAAYKPGIYFVELKQGKNTETIRLLKLKD